MKLPNKCDYCHEPINREEPFVIETIQGEQYFRCSRCEDELQEYANNPSDGFGCPQIGE